MFSCKDDLANLRVANTMLWLHLPITDWKSNVAPVACKLAGMRAYLYETLYPKHLVKRCKHAR